MTAHVTAEQVMRAVLAIRAELPQLIGADDWPNAREIVEKHLSRMQIPEHSAERHDTSMRLVDFLSRYDSVRTLLRARLLMTQLDLEPGPHLDAPQIDALQFFELHMDVQQDVRHVLINSEGAGGGKSRKLANLSLDSRRLLDALADTALGGAGLLSQDYRIALLTAVLAVVRGLNKAATVELGEKETRLFHAMIESLANVIPVPEPELLVKTNEHRRQLGLQEITAQDMRASLHALEQIRCIGRVPATPVEWRIIESFDVRPPVEPAHP